MVVFEFDTIRYDPELFVWEWNKNGNLVGIEKSSTEHRFTWQPHGSQFTIIEEIPETVEVIREETPNTTTEIRRETRPAQSTPATAPAASQPAQAPNTQDSETEYKPKTNSGAEQSEDDAVAEAIAAATPALEN